MTETAANRLTLYEAHAIMHGRQRERDLEPDADEALRCLLGPKNPDAEAWAELLAEEREA